MVLVHPGTHAQPPPSPLLLSDMLLSALSAARSLGSSHQGCHVCTSVSGQEWVTEWYVRQAEEFVRNAQQAKGVRRVSQSACPFLLPVNAQIGHNLPLVLLVNTYGVKAHHAALAAAFLVRGVQRAITQRERKYIRLSPDNTWEDYKAHQKLKLTKRLMLPSPTSR